MLNAFIDIWADSAIAQAKQLDLEAASGKWRGPLHGIPLAHKDCFERQGLPMTVGSKVTGTQLSFCYRDRGSRKPLGSLGRDRSLSSRCYPGF
jgi:Asp-tRNA(Asn)/Glu-tRNA(Gln) amidotransferase A subunit family amidase